METIFGKSSRNLSFIKHNFTVMSQRILGFFFYKVF